jgi:hypothetical protein
MSLLKSTGGEAFPAPLREPWQRGAQRRDDATSKLPAGTVLASGEIHLAGRLRIIQWREAGPDSRALSEALQYHQGTRPAEPLGDRPAIATGPVMSTLAARGVAPVDPPDLDAGTWSAVAAGIDWLTELHCSGSCSGAIFKSVSAELGLDFSRQPDVRRVLDTHMAAWFERQRALGNSPVTETDARREMMITVESTIKLH